MTATPPATARKQNPRARRGGFLALGVLAMLLPFGAARAGIQEGTVSWYGGQFHKRPTASGELFNANALTMAHPTLPFGTKVKVTNLWNGRSVVVRVNDRGPFVGHRIADLSRAAAQTLGMMSRGVAHARIEILGEDRGSEPAGNQGSLD
jgi:rare lipoprotein A